MQGKDVKGLAVIGIAGGAKLGTVERAYLDPASRRIVGFVVGAGSGVFGGSAAERSGIVDAGDVHSLGPDALTVNDAAAVRQDAALGQTAHLVDLDDLTKLKVVTEGGTDVGQVAGSEFDPATMQLTGIEISAGMFKSNTTNPIDRVVTIGQDVVVVSNAVGAEPAGGSGKPAPATAAPSATLSGAGGVSSPEPSGPTSPGANRQAPRHDAERSGQSR